LVSAQILYNKITEIMKCKNCPSTKAAIDNDPMYSSYLCLDCGYYYWENGRDEIEVMPFCLLIVDNAMYQPIAFRRALLKILRKYKAAEGRYKIELRKYFTDKSIFGEKTFFL